MPYCLLGSLPHTYRPMGPHAAAVLSQAPQADLPHILIPSKNRHHCLERTCRLAVATGARVTVCDQSSQAWTGMDGVEVLHCPNVPSLPAARNVLLRHADASLLIFIDDDTDLAADFAHQVWHLARCETEMSAWGPVIESRSRWTRRCVRMGHWGVMRDPRRLTVGSSDRPTRALFGCCFAVRRSMALAVGGFDCSRRGYSLGEDLDFFLRAQARGYRSRFSRRLRARHREERSGRYDPYARGAAKARWWLWLARRHGRSNPCTVLHVAWALVGGMSGIGREPGSLRGIMHGLRTPNADRLIGG